MNTQFALLARYGTNLLELKKISQEFFGISPKTAEQMAKACTLPVPSFKLRHSERSPTFIKVDDLANYIDKCHRQAKEDWLSVQ